MTRLDAARRALAKAGALAALTLTGTLFTRVGGVRRFGCPRSGTR
jgi:hypothetical protein